MGLGDFVWPFDKEFRKIPCAREAAIASLTGGLICGALSIVIKGRFKQAYKVSVYSGFGIFWVSFLYCRISNIRTQRMADQFVEAVKAGHVDKEDEKSSK